MDTNKARVLAERVAAKMLGDDGASQMLGMRIVQVDVGHAIVEMEIRGDMINGHGTCHGGMIFTLADSAFAFTCNGTNVVTVASGCNIEFVIPARLGDVLTAEGREVAVQGRSSICDICVTNQDGKTVALFRGRGHRIQGQHHFPPESL